MEERKMKKISIVLIVMIALVALVSCATKAAEEEVVVAAAEPVAEAPAADVCPWAGEYYFEFTSADSPDPVPGEEFVIEADWTLHGASEGSGMTGFVGKVNPDGSFEAEFTRLGGTLVGQLYPDFTFTAHAETRGRTSEQKGYRL